MELCRVPLIRGSHEHEKSLKLNRSHENGTFIGAEINVKQWAYMKRNLSPWCAFLFSQGTTESTFRKLVQMLSALSLPVKKLSARERAACTSVALGCISLSAKSSSLLLWWLHSSGLTVSRIIWPVNVPHTYWQHTEPARMQAPFEAMNMQSPQDSVAKKAVNPCTHTTSTLAQCLAGFTNLSVRELVLRNASRMLWLFVLPGLHSYRGSAIANGRGTSQIAHSMKVMLDLWPSQKR